MGSNHRMTGSKPVALSLGYSPIIWSGRLGTIQQHSDWKSDTLPIELRPHFNKTHSVTELNRVKHSTYQHLLSNPAEPDQGRMCFIKSAVLYCESAALLLSALKLSPEWFEHSFPIQEPTWQMTIIRGRYYRLLLHH